jgi:hypothetical protein
VPIGRALWHPFAQRSVRASGTQRSGADRQFGCSRMRIRVPVRRSADANSSDQTFVARTSTPRLVSQSGRSASSALSGGMKL